MNPGAAKSATIRSAKANQHAVESIVHIYAAVAHGAETLRDIAAWLNSQGLTTLRGAKWTSVQVLRVQRRAAVLLL